jgi:hypothetical protein
MTLRSAGSHRGQQPYPRCAEPSPSHVGEASGPPLRGTRYAELTAPLLGGPSGPPLVTAS